jgi:tetratricopeptide (TPR) repeat protein
MNSKKELKKQIIIAQKAFANGEYDKAITTLQVLFKIFPNSSEIGSFLGLCYLKNNEPLQALLILKDCPLSDDVEVTLSQLYSLGTCFSTLRLYTFAIETYKKLLSLADSAEIKEEVYFQLSASYSMDNRWEEANAAAKEGLAINSSWYRLKYSLSMSYLFLKNKQQAIAMADELKSSQPSLAAELYEMIENDSPEQDKIDEIEGHRKAEEHYLRATEMIKHREMESAINELIEALGYDDKYASAITMLGCIYDNYNLLDEGLTMHRKAIEVDSKHALAYSNMGYVFQTQGDKEGALNAYLKALEIDPDLVQAHNSVGVLYDNLGDYEKGISHFLEAYRIEPDRFGTHNNLGYAYRAVNKIEESLFHYKKAVTIAPGNIDLRLTIAAIYKDSGRVKEAVAEYLAALSVDPDSLRVWSEICWLFREMGHEEGMYQALEKVAELSARDHVELFLKAKCLELSNIPKSFDCWKQYLTLAEEMPLDRERVSYAQNRVKMMSRIIN